METKICKKCGVEKSISEFSSKHSTCKLCILGPCKIRKTPPIKQLKGEAKDNYIAFTMHGLTGNDY